MALTQENACARILTLLRNDFNFFLNFCTEGTGSLPENIWCKTFTVKVSEVVKRNEVYFKLFCWIVNS